MRNRSPTNLEEDVAVILWVFGNQQLRQLGGLNFEAAVEFFHFVLGQRTHFRIAARDHFCGGCALRLEFAELPEPCDHGLEL
jgi:hypothetical protein